MVGSIRDANRCSRAPLAALYPTTPPSPHNIYVGWWVRVTVSLVLLLILQKGQELSLFQPVH